jgi:hypothetical protein
MNHSLLFFAEFDEERKNETFYGRSWSYDNVKKLGACKRDGSKAFYNQWKQTEERFRYELSIWHNFHRP